MWILFVLAEFVFGFGEWESDVVNGTLVEANLDPEVTLNPVKWDGDWESADSATKGER